MDKTIATVETKTHQMKSGTSIDEMDRRLENSSRPIRLKQPKLDDMKN